MSREAVRRPPRVVATVALAVVALVTAVGCSGDPTDASVTAAQVRVTTKENALADAQREATSAQAAFCSATTDYVTALDRYGDILTATAPTVGDVKDAGSDLEQPGAAAADAASAVVDARGAVATAEQELADAQAALAAAEAAAAGTTTEPSDKASSTGPTPTTTPVEVTRVQEAQTEFDAARTGISDQTPLRQAAEQFNAAAVALEMAWLQLLGQSGCLSDEQQQQATETVSGMTKTLQQALADTGYYEGKVDGIYGPKTVDAVQALQKANGLPQTGTVDKATEQALRSELAAKGGAAAQAETASTAALQQTLKLAGYWDGPVDGQWTDALTDALSELQADLGVKVTGTVDAATIAAFEKALAAATSSPSPGSSDSTSPSASPSG